MITEAEIGAFKKIFLTISPESSRSGDVEKIEQFTINRINEYAQTVENFDKHIVAEVVDLSDNKNYIGFLKKTQLAHNLPKQFYCIQPEHLSTDIAQLVTMLMNNTTFVNKIQNKYIQTKVELLVTKKNTTLQLKHPSITLEIKPGEIEL